MILSSSNINEVPVAEKAALLKKLMGKGWSMKLAASSGKSRQAMQKMVDAMNYQHEDFHHAVTLAEKGKPRFEAEQDARQRSEDLLNSISQK